MKRFARFSASGGISFQLKNSALCCLVFLSIALQAQSDSIHTDVSLPETTIHEQRFNRTGYTSWKADSIPALAVIALSSRLFWESGLQVRQNAPGTLATISARGAGPSRTAVLWNGLPLQSVMNGVVDATLLPLWSGDQLEVLQGGNSAAQSSGAMGGSVIIESPFLPDQPEISGKVQMESGSYGMKGGQGEAEYAPGKWASRIRAHWQTGINNFPYDKIGLNGQAYTTRQLNNFAEKTDVQQFNRLIINHKNLVKTAAWFQNSFRQIPPAATEAAHNTWQRDRSGRAVATWDYTPNRHSKLQSRIAFQDELIGFHFAGETERSRAQTALTGLEWRTQKGKHLEWRLGGTAQYIRAASDGYQRKMAWYQETRSAIFATGEKTIWHAGKISALIRQEWTDAKASPFTWTIGWELPILSTGLVRGHISRNYNLPTFNDRYWKTLENNVLTPEKGYSADIGLVVKKQYFGLELTAFQLSLDDWILWQPGPDGIFRPGNLKKVLSRGLETAANIAFDFWGVHWKTKGRFQWSETKNVAVYGGSETVLGKQLPYTPALSASGGLWATRKGFSGAYLHQFTGNRFVTTDNKILAPYFQTGTLMLRYDLGNCRFWHWSRSLVFEVTMDNIWDVAYESLANRPMPGRNWRAGLTIGW